MRRALIRTAVTAIALLAFWLLLLGWAARVTPGQPWSSAHTLDLRVGRITTVFGVAEERTDGLRISALGAEALGLQTWRVKDIKAKDYSVLRYRFKDLPRNLSVDLIIRTAEHSHDVVSVTLPWPGARGGAIDLASLPQWHGTITEIGFSEYGNPQLVPPDAPFSPFTLVGASLQQSSWSSALDMLTTDWFGYRSWQQSSINSLAEDALSGVRPMLLVVALAALGSALLLWLLARVSLRRSMILALLVTWLVLDAHWLGVLGERNTQTRAWYADSSWPQRQRLQADRDLVEGAAQVKQVLAGEPQGRHVLVWAPSQFARGRLSYHLRPLNVRDLPAGNLADLAPGSALLLDDDVGVWHYDASAGLLSDGSRTIHVQPLWHHDPFNVYRITAARGTP